MATERAKMDMLFFLIGVGSIAAFVVSLLQPPVQPQVYYIQVEVPKQRRNPGCLWLLAIAVVLILIVAASMR